MITVILLLIAAVLGVGNLAGWWVVSWWLVVAIWPGVPLLLLTIFIGGGAGVWWLLNRR